MEGNSIIQLINEMSSNGELFSGLPIMGQISISDNPGIKTIITESVVTGLITAIATYIGAKIGSRNTIKLYQEQEKVRIREELKVKFYDEYEGLYKDTYLKLGELISHIEYLRFLFFLEQDDFEEGSHEKDINVTGIESIEDIKRDLDEEVIKELEVLIKDLQSKMNNLKRFLDMKSNITGYKSFIYFDIEYIIREINSAYEGISILPIIAKESDGDSHCLSREEIIKSYNDNMFKILNSLFKKIVEGQEDMDKIHKSISDEYIGSYFNH